MSLLVCAYRTRGHQCMSQLDLVLPDFVLQVMGPDDESKGTIGGRLVGGRLVEGCMDPDDWQPIDQKFIDEVKLLPCFCQGIL